MPGMKAGRRLLGGKQGDILREVVVERVDEVLRGKLFPRFQVRNLSERMHARVGPSGALDIHLAGKDDFCGLQEFPLHAGRILLRLPAAVARAVVLDEQFVLLFHDESPCVLCGSAGESCAGMTIDQYKSNRAQMPSRSALKVTL